MPAGYLLPGFGLVIETQSTGALLPGFGLLVETQAVSSPKNVFGGVMFDGPFRRVVFDRLRHEHD